MIAVDFGRAARARLGEAGLPVTYRESPLPHAVDPAFAVDLRGWLGGVLPGRTGEPSQS